MTQGLEFERVVERNLSERFWEVTKSKDGLSDFTIKDDINGIILVEARLTRKNLSYYIGRLLNARESYAKMGLEVKLAIALPIAEITSSVKRRCDDASIQIIEINFDIGQGEKFTIEFNMSDPDDKALFIWLKIRSSYERQRITKTALRNQMNNEFQPVSAEDFRTFANLMMGQIDKIQQQLEKLSQKWGEKREEG